MINPELTEKSTEKLEGYNSFPNIFPLLIGLFGENIMLLDGIYPPEKKKKFTSILYGFYSLILDPGLSRKVDFSYKGEKFQEEPVYMVGRAAFLERTLKMMEQIRSENLAFLILDLADVGFADMVKDESGNRTTSADLLINRFARKLLKAIEEVQKEFDKKLDGRKIHLFAGRYGGDEFAVSVLGDYRPEDIKEIVNIIKNKISGLKNQALYKRFNGEIEKEEWGDICLKNQTIEVIDFSSKDDEYSKKIFFHYLRKGLILNKEQIDIIKKSYPKDDDFTKAVVEPYELTILNQQEVDVDERIQRVISLHPELKLPFSVAAFLDEQEKKGVKEHQRVVLSFFERILIDKIFGFMVYPYYDFIQHVEKEKITKIMVFDLKIKEFNDIIGLAFTDDLINQLWIRIKNSIKEEDWSKLIVGRRGGSFFLAVREGEEISSESMTSLSNISSISFQASQSMGEFSIPLGVAIVEKSHDGTIERAMKEAEINFYNKVINDLLNNPQLVEVLKSSSPPHSKKEKYSKEDFYWLYFWGKRYFKRCSEILAIINLTREQREGLNELKEVFENILNQKKVNIKEKNVH